MPGYKGHLVGGICTFALILYSIDTAGIAFTQFQAAQWFISAIIGCLFPDVDVKSKGQNIFYKSMLCALLFMLFYGYHRPFMLVSIAAMVPMVVRHRGLFHRLWFIVSMPMILALYLASSYPIHAPAIYFNALFFTLGAISHLWLDLGFKRMIFS